MKFHDWNETLGLSLVTDEDGSNWRYERQRPTGCAPLEATPSWLLRQGHYVANAIAQGLVIVGRRIELVPQDWKRHAGRDPRWEGRCMTGAG